MGAGARDDRRGADRRQRRPSPLYTALGTRIHLQDQPYGHGLYEAALTEVGLDPALATAAGHESHDDAVGASHRAAALPSGDTELGSPTLNLPGPDGEPVAILGPVVSPIPHGKLAGQLWDATAIAATVPGFIELKSGRDRTPAFG